MAEGKKSFLFYVNWLSTFENLTDEEAGKLIKHLLKYVNNLNPEAPDRLTKLVFEPLKQVLKMDLKKYENIVERNRVNGYKGGRPKGNPEKPKKPTGLFGNPKEPKKADIDIDIDIDKDIVLSKDNNIGDFDKVVLEWFAYKKERKESYKSERSKKAFITSLRNLSGNNANLARKIIEQSMANNWAGIFELKNISAQQKVSETIYTEF